MSESLFPEYHPNKDYFGGFWPRGSTEIAYRALEVNGAIFKDDLPRIKEAIKLGWITKETRCFDNCHVVDYCDGRDAVKIAAYLRAQGWPEWRPA